MLWWQQNAHRELAQRRNDRNARAERCDRCVVARVSLAAVPICNPPTLQTARPLTYDSSMSAPAARVLLLLPTTTYRADPFLDAARRMGVEVTLASDRCASLAKDSPDA